MAYEFGRIDDAQPPGNWQGISEARSRSSATHRAGASSASRFPTSLSTRPSIKDVTESSAVAVAAGLDSHRRAVRAIFGTADVTDTGPPTPRMGPLRQTSAAAPANRRRVLLAVVTVACRVVAQQSAAARVSADAVENKNSRPTALDGVKECRRIFGYFVPLNEMLITRRGRTQLTSGRERSGRGTFVPSRPGFKHGHGGDSQ